MDSLSSTDPKETSEYDNAVDMWSLGCVVYNITAGVVPFPSVREIYKFCLGVKQLPEGPLGSRMGQAGVRFVSKLLQPLPTDRMSVKDALYHDWLHDHGFKTRPKDAQAPHSGLSPRHRHLQTRPKDARTPSSRLLRQRHQRHGRISISDKVETPSREDVRQTLSNGQIDAQQVSTTRVAALSLQPTGFGKAARLDGSRDRLVSSMSISLFNGRRDRPETVPPSYSMPVAAFLPDNRLIDRSVRSTSLMVWDLTAETAEQIWFPELGDSLYAGQVFSVSPVKAEIAVALPGAREINFINLNNQTAHHEIPAKGEFWCYSMIKHSRDGRFLLCGSLQSSLMLWDLEKSRGTVLSDPAQRIDFARQASFSEDNRLVAVGPLDRGLRRASPPTSVISVWDTETGQLKATRILHEQFFNFSFLQSPSGCLMIILKKHHDWWWSSRAMIWDVTTNTVLSETSQPQVWMSKTNLLNHFSPRGDLLAVNNRERSQGASENDIIEIWDTRTMQIQETIAVRGNTLDLSFSPDGTFIGLHVERCENDRKLHSFDLYRLAK